MALLLAIVIATSFAPATCIGLSTPADAEIVRGFLPTGRYSGHWGIDLAVPVGAPARAAGDGVVSFAGLVVRNRTVTVDHGGVKTSYSYLSETHVRAGDRVRRGAVVGTAGIHDGRAALHFSVRVDGTYVDPQIALRCDHDPHDGLWLRALDSKIPYPAPMRAILGGTFDPPHIAHLVAGETAHDQLGVETVTYLPAGRPWQKVGTGVSEARHRLRMIELATKGVDYFDVDDREVHRDGWTYTIDTVESFEDEEIILIVGADSAKGLRTWNRASELIERVRIAVVPRPGVARADVGRVFDGDVEWLDMPELEISGTMLRRRVADGLSIRFMVPGPVRDYVNEHHLYAEPREAWPPAT